MKSKTQLSRRDFIAAAAGSALLLGTPPARGASPRPARTRHEICAFTKPLQSLSYSELAERIAEIGFDGVEATIREGGHIEPEAAPDELPKMVEALRKHGLKMTIMTSSINEVNKVSEAQLRAAAALGVKLYRTKYYRYDLKRPLIPQLDEYRGKVEELAALNRELGIAACYQNHSGARHVGAPVWDLERLLRGIPPEEFGVAFDIRHATVEGGMSWPAHFALVRSRINIVYVKDFKWARGKARPVNIPLGAEGSRVDPKFFELLASSGFAGPISLHEEYLDHRDPKLVPRHLEALRSDLSTLRRWLRG